MRKLSFLAIVFVFLLGLEDRLPACLAQTQNEPGSITGRVKLDGKPVKGITIIATPSVTDPAKVVEEMFGSSASMKATTDSDGIYRFENVSAGKYRIAPSAPTLVSVDPNSAGMVTVAEGSVAEGVDFALSPGGVITGVVTDSDGRPVIGEGISIKSLDNPNAAGSGTATFGNRMYATDDRGVYRVFGLRPGRYIVSAANQTDVFSSFLSQRPKRVQTFYPSVTDEAKAKPVQVTPGSEAAGVDIQFSGTDKGFVVSGRVLDSDNKTPIANAMVAYAKTVKEGTDEASVTTDTVEVEVANLSGMPGGFTTTNEKGEFRFASVAPGSYKIETTSIGALAGTGGSQFYADPLAFEVMSTNVDKLDIKVHRGAVISGIIVIESADARDSLDRFGQLMLMAMVTDEATKSYSSGNCVVGPDGSFRLGGLKPGKLTIRPFSMSARSPGVLRIERNGVEVHGKLEIQPKEEVTGLRIILAPAIGVIRGRVTVQGGALQPGVSVTAHARQVNADPSEFNDDSDRTAVTVNPNGTFIIENLTPGSYEVQVSTTARGQRGSRRVSAKQTVTVTSDTPAEVELVLDLSPTASDK